MKILREQKDVKNMREYYGEKLLIRTMFLNLILLLIYIFNSQYANIFNLFNSNVSFFSLTAFITVFMNLVMIYFSLSINRILLYFPVNNEFDDLKNVFTSNPIELLIVQLIQYLIKFGLLTLSLFIILGNILKNGINSGIITPYNFFNPQLLQAGFLEMNSEILLRLFSWKHLLLTLIIFICIELISIKFSGAKYLVMMDNAAVGIFKPFINSYIYISGNNYKTLLKIRFKYILYILLPIPFLVIPLIFSSKVLLIIYLIFILFYQIYIRSIYLIEEALFLGHGPLSLRLYEHILYKSNIAKKNIKISNNAKICRYS